MHLLSFCCIVYEMSAINFYLDEVKSDFLSKKAVLVKAITILMKSAKIATLGLFKINIMTS